MLNLIQAMNPLRKNPTYNSFMTHLSKKQAALKPDPVKCPPLVKLLIWAFSFWGLLGWLRFSRTILERHLVLDVLTGNYFGYLIGSGLVVGLLAFPVIFGLWRRLTWARPLTCVAAVLLPIAYWFERLFLWRDGASQGNWLFVLLLTALWFGLVTWALYSKPSRRYFSAGYKRK